MAVAQPLQGAGAADPLAGGEEPKRHQEPRRRHRPAGLIAPRLDPMFEFAKVEAGNVGPDHARRMVLSDQALDIDRAQFNLVALRLAQARHSLGRSIGSRTGGINSRSG